VWEKNMFEVIMEEYFSILVKDRNVQIQEVQQIPNKICLQNSMPRRDNQIAETQRQHKNLESSQ